MASISAWRVRLGPAARSAWTSVYALAIPYSTLVLNGTSLSYWVSTFRNSRIHGLERLAGEGR